MSIPITIDNLPAASPDRGQKLALYAQVAMVVVALLALALAPPREGPMMVIPLGHGAIGQTMEWALPNSAAFLGQGPLPGSILVYAERDRLTDGAWQNGSLLIRAPEIFCGDIAGSQRSL